MRGRDEAEEKAQLVHNESRAGVAEVDKVESVLRTGPDDGDETGEALAFVEVEQFIACRKPMAPGSPGEVTHRVGAEKIGAEFTGRADDGELRTGALRGEGKGMYT